MVCDGGMGKALRRLRCVHHVHHTYLYVTPYSYCQSLLFPNTLVSGFCLSFACSCPRALGRLLFIVHAVWGMGQRAARLRVLTQLLNVPCT